MTAFETPGTGTLPAVSGTIPGAGFPAAPGQAGAVPENHNRRVVGRTTATAAPALHVIGLDVSLTATGVTCQHGATLVQSRGRKADTLDDRHARLGSLTRRILDEITHDGLPPLVVVEQPSYGSQGGSQHDRSGIWWLVVDQLLRRGVRVIEIAPATLKKYAAGKGNADKDAVLSAGIRRLPIDGIDNNNSADAAWLCAIGCDLLGQPICDLPAVNRTAIDKHRGAT